MSRVYIERPDKKRFKFTNAQVELFVGSWYRIAEEDGSTVAYTPDMATAKFIAEKINEGRGGK